MHTKRFRLQHKFWLDMEKPEERELAEVIEGLKQERSFSRVVRAGIRLMVDLWQGNLDVLLALFPWVEEAFYERFAERQSGSEFDLQAQLERLERLLLEQGNQPITAVPSPSLGGGPKPMKVPLVSAPDADDDAPVTLEVRKSAPDGRSAQNFLDSAFSLVG